MLEEVDRGLGRAIARLWEWWRLGFWMGWRWGSRAGKGTESVGGVGVVCVDTPCGVGGVGRVR